MGFSTGRWEGDTLVVTTKNFKHRSVYRHANADTLTLTERFQRAVRDLDDSRRAAVFDSVLARMGPPGTV
jgi:hypothetical protein